MSDTDSLDAAMCNGQGDVSMSSFKVATPSINSFFALNLTLPFLQGTLRAHQAAEQREEADEEGSIS